MINKEKLLNYLFNKANKLEFEAECSNASIIAYTLRKVAYKIESGEFEAWGEGND